MFVFFSFFFRKSLYSIFLIESTVSEMYWELQKGGKINKRAEAFYTVNFMGFDGF